LSREAIQDHLEDAGIAFRKGPNNTLDPGPASGVVTSDIE